MVSAPSVTRGFFPLDEELELLAGHFAPSVYEGIARMRARMPFESAVKELRYFWQVTVTEPTVRRHWAYARSWLHREMKKNLTSV